MCRQFGEKIVLSTKKRANSKFLPQLHFQTFIISFSATFRKRNFGQFIKFFYKIIEIPMLFLTCRWSHHSCRTWESILPPVKGTGKSGSSGILEFYLLASFFTTFAHKSASLALSFFSSVGVHSSTFYRYFPHFFFRGSLGVGLRAGE